MSLFKKKVEKAVQTVKEAVHKSAKDDVKDYMDITVSVALLVCSAAVVASAWRSGSHAGHAVKSVGVPAMTMTNIYLGEGGK